VFAALATSLVIGGQSYANGQAALSGSGKWHTAPGVIRPSSGKYPSPVNIDLFPPSCDRDAKTGKWLKAADTFKITATGAGLTVGAPTVGDCKLTATATIDPAAQPDEYYLDVSDQPTGGTSSDAGDATLILLDSTAGATPSTPEVDIQWKVLSQNACSDAFGNHVASVFYCVQVTVGNNSAYKLQIASVGFKSTNPLEGLTGSPDEIIQPNTSYQTTRAVAQEGQTTTARNLIFNGLGATGLIMAAFTPYFHNPINSTKWSAGASIVSSTFTAAMNLVAPDLTVRELTALDDESLQDGKIISNNTVAAPFDVFVDKKDTKQGLSFLTEQVQELKSPDDHQKALAKALSKCEKGKFQSCDPLLVKLALGEVVITGDKISFYQRIVVASPSVAQPANAPSLANGQTFSVAADGTPHSISLTGQNLVQVTGAVPNVPDPNVSGLSISNATPTSATLNITVQKGDASKTIQLLLEYPSGTVPISVTAQ
jgi:hypothetical protein